MTNPPTTKSEALQANAEKPMFEDIDMLAVLSFNLLRIFRQSSHPRYKLKALEIYARLNGLNASDQVRVQRNCSVSVGAEEESGEPQVETELSPEEKLVRDEMAEIQLTQ